MTDYCRDSGLRAWALGPNLQCDGDFETCGKLILKGKQPYCGYTPSRCSLHQIIRSQAGCRWCKHAAKSLNSAKCAECLSAGSRINYESEVIHADS